MATAKGLSKLEALLPKKIWIGSKDFNIHVVPDADHNLQDSDAVGTSGLRSRNIWIGQGQTPTQLLDTVIHEITHCANDVIGFGSEVEKYEEEKYTTAAGSVWACIYIHNPKLLDFYVAAVKEVAKERA